MTSSLTRLFNATLKDLINGDNKGNGANDDGVDESSDDHDQSSIVRYLNPPIGAIDASFLFALVWSVGGCVDTKSRNSFDKFLKSVIRTNEFSLSCPGRLWSEEGSSVYDFKIYAPEGTGVERLQGIAWQKWIDSIPAEARLIPKGLPFDATIVPTKETATCDHLLDCALRHGYPVLFCGPTGTGKSTIIQRKLSSLDKSKWQPTTIGFSARTSANATQAQVDEDSIKDVKVCLDQFQAQKACSSSMMLICHNASRMAHNPRSKFLDNFTIMVVGMAEITRSEHSKMFSSLLQWARPAAAEIQ